MQFIKGMDISIQNEIEKLGAKYFDNGKQRDALDIFKDYNINAIRLRLWCDPYDESTRPYGGGMNDLPTTIQLAKRIKEKDMQFILDIHYSDFWTDPKKQIKPKAWQHLVGKALEDQVYNYTYDELSKLRQYGLEPSMVQIGNEITNGFLWPDGRFENYQTMVKLLSAGIQAVNDFNSEIKTIIHLDCGGDNKLYRNWFDKISYANLNFDIIGLSYYPFWHGTIEELSFNMNDISKQYDKDLMVVETAFGFTTEHTNIDKMVFSEETAKTVDYRINTKGQAQFLLDLMQAIKSVENSRGLGFIYWEPTWINIEQAFWASNAGKEYIKDDCIPSNVWANLALFDYDGNSLPALKTIRDFR